VITTHMAIHFLLYLADNITHSNTHNQMDLQSTYVCGVLFNHWL